MRLERVSAAKQALAALLNAVSIPAGAQAPSPEAAPPPVAFVDVSLVPMDRERVVPHQTVLVRDGHIAAIGPADSVALHDDEIQRIDGRGRYLMPGLSDLHVHLFNSRDLLLYVANGVTTIRNLGGYGDADSILEIREEVAAGERLGPTIYTSGNWLDGDPPFRPINTVVRTPEDAFRIVREQSEAGYDFIKVYGALQPDVYEAILQAARVERIPVTGHIPAAVRLEGVLRGSQIAIDHLASCLFLSSHEDGETEQQWIARMARQIAEDGTAVTTALVMFRQSVDLRGNRQLVTDLLAEPEARYVSPDTREFWTRAPFIDMPRTVEIVARYETARHMPRKFLAAGVHLLLGTDAGLWVNPPGFSVHTELRILVEGGLTPYQALRTTTVNAAAFLNRYVPGADEPGILEVGKRADLLLLQGNPLADVANAGRRVGIMLRGAWHPASRLEGRLERLAAEYSPAGSGLDALREGWIAAYEAGELDEMADLYVQDAVRMPYDAPAAVGRDRILAAYQAQFTNRRLFPDIEFIVEQVDILGQVAIERGRYDELLKAADGTTRIHELGKYVSVARRGSDGRWRYAISIFNRDAPPGSTSTSPAAERQ